MSSTVACPHCQAPIPHMPDLAGRKITCGNCKGGFEMPASPGDAPTPLTAAPPPAPAPEPTPTPAPPPIPAPEPDPPAVNLADPALEEIQPPDSASQPLPTAMQVAAPVPTAMPTAPTGQMGIGAGPSSFRRTVNQRFEPSSSILDLFDWKFQKYVTPLIIRITWKMVVAIILCATVYYLVGPEVWAGAGASSSDVSTTEFRVPVWMIMVLQRIVVAVMMLLTLLWIRVLLEMVVVIFNIAGGVTEIEKNTSGRID